MPPEHRRAGCLSFWYFPGLSDFFVCARTCYELLDQLGFMALQNTEPRAVSLLQSSTFVVFPDLHSACAAASVLRDKTAVDAVEMFDRASLRCGFVFHRCVGFYQGTSLRMFDRMSFRCNSIIIVVLASIKRLKGRFRVAWVAKTWHLLKDIVWQHTGSRSLTKLEQEQATLSLQQQFKWCAPGLRWRARCPGSTSGLRSSHLSTSKPVHTGSARSTRTWCGWCRT